MDNNNPTHVGKDYNNFNASLPLQELGTEELKRILTQTAKQS